MMNEEKGNSERFTKSLLTKMFPRGFFVVGLASDGNLTAVSGNPHDIERAISNAIINNPIIGGMLVSALEHTEERVLSSDEARAKFSRAMLSDLADNNINSSPELDDLIREFNR